MQTTKSNVTRLASRRHGWHSRYLPKVERHEAARVIKRMCRQNANDNHMSSIVKWLSYFAAKHQTPLTICGITLITAIITAAKVLG